MLVLWSHENLYQLKLKSFLSGIEIDRYFLGLQVKNKILDSFGIINNQFYSLLIRFFLI